MTGAFALHPRLRADGIELGRIGLSRLLLMNDAHYPWCILVPERAGVTEIYQLSAEDRRRLSDDSAWLGERMMECFRGDKLNVAAIGNLVPQLHIHHVVRYRTDPAWPSPVWGKLPARPYPPRLLEERLAALREALSPVLQPVAD